MEMSVMVVELQVKEELGWCVRAGCRPGVDSEVGSTPVVPFAV